MKHGQAVWAVESGRFLEKPRVREGVFQNTVSASECAVVHQDGTRQIYDSCTVFTSYHKAEQYLVFLLMEKKVLTLDFLREINMALNSI